MQYIITHTKESFGLTYWGMMPREVYVSEILGLRDQCFQKASLIMSILIELWPQKHTN